jgi:transposase-like protein
MERIKCEVGNLRRILRRKRWKAEDAGEVVRAIEKSGMSAAEFCRQCGLGYTRIVRWRRRLGKKAAQRRQGALLLPIRVVKDVEPEQGSATGEGQWAVELDCGGFCLRVSETATEELISRALGAAKERLC